MLHSRTPVLLLGLILASPLPGWAGECEGCAPPPGHGCGAPGCCAPPVCKTCVPVPDVVKHAKTVYTCRGADICLPKRSLADLFQRSCGKSGCCESGDECGDGCGSPCSCDCPPCSCPQCECRARHKMVLLKKVVTKECPAFKCEAVCCPAGCGGCTSPCFDAAPLPEHWAPVPDEATPPKKPVPVPPSASRQTVRKAR